MNRLPSSTLSLRQLKRRVKSFEQSVSEFLVQHKLGLREYSYSASEFCEMAVYNAVVTFYKKRGFTATMINTAKGIFLYKVKASGYPHNFSYCTVTKIGAGTTYSFDIFQNLAIESSISEGIYYTADVAVVTSGAVAAVSDPESFYGGTKRAYYAAPREELQTFVEVKAMAPFPELLFNFVGLVYEFANDIFRGKKRRRPPRHLAPSLVVSGLPSRHASKVRDTLMERIHLNIFVGFATRRAQLYDTGAEERRLIWIALAFTRVPDLAGLPTQPPSHIDAFSFGSPGAQTYPARCMTRRNCVAPCLE